MFWNKNGQNLNANADWTKELKTNYVKNKGTLPFITSHLHSSFAKQTKVRMNGINAYTNTLIIKLTVVLL